MEANRFAPVYREDGSGEHETWCPCQECRQLWLGEPTTETRLPEEEEEADSDSEIVRK